MFLRARGAAAAPGGDAAAGQESPGAAVAPRVELIWSAARERPRRRRARQRRWGVQGGLCPPWPPEASHETRSAQGNRFCAATSACLTGAFSPRATKRKTLWLDGSDAHGLAATPSVSSELDRGMHPRVAFERHPAGMRVAAVHFQSGARSMLALCGCAAHMMCTAAEPLERAR